MDSSGGFKESSVSAPTPVSSPKSTGKDDYLRQKEEQALRDNLQIGDEITTIGGIVGKVVTIKEDAVVIETGADRVKIKFLRGAIQTNNTATAKLQAEREAAMKARQDAKANKKGKNTQPAEENKTAE